MNEGDAMDNFLTEIKDLKEQLIAADEALSDCSFVQTFLNGLPNSYQSFDSTLCLVMKGNPNAFSFKELIFVLLQEDQSRQNRSIMHVADQAFWAGQKGKGKIDPMTGNPKPAYVVQSKKEDKDEKKAGKQKVFCKYCKATNHVIKSCPKLAANEAKKKDVGMVVVDVIPSTSDSTNVVQESKWACTV